MRGSEETKQGRGFHSLLLIVPSDQLWSLSGVSLLVYKMAIIISHGVSVLGLLSPLDIRGCAGLVMRNSFSNAFYQMLVNTWDYLLVYRDQMALNMFSPSALRIFKSSECLLSESSTLCHSADISSATLRAVLVLTENAWKHPSPSKPSFHSCISVEVSILTHSWLCPREFGRHWRMGEGSICKENHPSPYEGLISLWPRKPEVESSQVKVFFLI